MGNKSIEAGIVYVQSSDNPLNILSDLESFVLFLNTNEFIPTEISVSAVHKKIVQKKKIDISTVRRHLTKAQAQILDRYISLFTQIQSLPTLDDEIAIFEDDISSLQAQSPVVQSALVEPNTNPQFYNPLTNVQSELDVLSQKESYLLEKEENLFNREQQQAAKEYVIANEVTSLQNLHVRNVIQKIEEKIYHLDAMSSEFSEQERNMHRAQNHYDRRQNQLELSTAKLLKMETALQAQLTSKQIEFDKIQILVIEKSKELRSRETSLLQTNKQFKKIGDSLQKREQTLSLTEFELKKREQSLDDSWDKVNELKHEVITKQNVLAKRELELVKKYDERENELLQSYTVRVKELEREYNSKLKNLDHEFDSLSLKKKHLETESTSLEHEKKKLGKERKEIKLLKLKYDLQTHNRLDTIKSVRSHSVKTHPAKKHLNKKIVESESESVETIRTLLEIAESETFINPQLAKKTYKRVHQIYQLLPFSEQTKIHGLIVSVHGKIRNSLSDNTGEAL